MKKILYIAIVLVISLTACKYEEGPGISLRSKRDRISNEWLVSNYTFTPKDSTSVDATDIYNVKGAVIYTYTTDSNGLVTDSTVEDYSYVYTINRTGAYNLGVVDGDGNSVDPRKMASYTTSAGRASFNTIPDPLSKFSVGSRGEWSFVDKHSRIQFQSDVAGNNFDGVDSANLGNSIPVLFDVVKLANDEVKLTNTDRNGTKHEYTLSPISEEGYLNFKHLVDAE
jgi:hypothetical protein